MDISKLFNEFVNSEKSSGLILIICSALSIFLANSLFGPDYLHLWHFNIFSKPLEFWINDGLMSLFFLLVGLEIEREIYVGELADIKKSMLPILAAAGGMIFPAIIHFSLNSGTIYQSGFGIPMATDIAFSLGILSLLGSRVPFTLKVFLTALAIIDDLGAILIIAFFYSSNFSLLFFGLAVLIYAVMIFMNRRGIFKLWPYLLLGCALWYFVYLTGIHPTITGVLLAFAIPFRKGDDRSPSFILEHNLHKLVAFFILPVFALANTAILLPSSVGTSLSNSNSIGIMAGLILGKPLGIIVFSVAGAALGLCAMPEGVKIKHILGTGMLAGIGFTMSIFITILAFSDNIVIVNSKISVLTASVFAGLLGYLWLYFTLPRNIIQVEKE